MLNIEGFQIIDSNLIIEKTLLESFLLDDFTDKYKIFTAIFLVYYSEFEGNIFYTQGLHLIDLNHNILGYQSNQDNPILNISLSYMSVPSNNVINRSFKLSFTGFDFTPLSIIVDDRETFLNNLVIGIDYFNLIDIINVDDINNKVIIDLNKLPKITNNWNYESILYGLIITMYFDNNSEGLNTFIYNINDIYDEQWILNINTSEVF